MKSRQVHLKMIKPFRSLKLHLFILTMGCMLLPVCTSQAVPYSQITVGALYNLSGDQSGLDIPSSRGAMLAAEQLNRNGGLLGSRLHLTLLDGESDPEVLRKKTLQQMKTNPDTAAFIGLSDTDMVLVAARVAAGNKRVFLTSGATSPKLPSQVPDFLFLACFGDNVQAAAAAEFAYRKKNARSVAVVYDATETYTRLLHAYFITRFKQLGGQVVSVRGYNGSNMKSVVEQLPQADLVFLAAMPQHALLAVQLIRKAGFALPVIGGDAFDSEGIWDGKTAISDVYYTTHAYLKADNPDPKVLTFQKEYRARFGQDPDAFAALGYDTVHLLAQAIIEAKSAEPGAILNGMAAMNNFDGITGKISYTDGSHIPRKSVTIMEVKNGSTVFVMQVLPEQIPSP